MFVGRVAKEDIPLHGKVIPKNSGILLLFGSANRDAEAFPDPDTFQPERQSNRHLAFGQGRHSCIGGPLVKLEMTTAFQALAQAFPKLSATPEPKEWTPRLGHRWLAKLPVIVGAS